ncbi:MAG: phytanoyl-CoA dioxygenase family protein [Opitutales bacterium]
MSLLSPPRLIASGHTLNPSQTAFGELRDSSGIADDAAALRARYAEDGYLYLPGYLDRESVLEARRDVCTRLAADGLLDAAHDPVEGILSADASVKFRPDIATGNPVVEALLYGPRLLGFYERLLGGPVRHFDFTWFRAVSPGHGAPPHCDAVYMNRGTFNLYTAWVPFGDVTRELGGLMILEESHRKADRLRKYLESDVDSYCENKPRHLERVAANKAVRRGQLSYNPVSLRERLGGRWLTADFRAGDLLTFGMATVHASLDNQTDNLIRLSSDSRYQLAAEPADERWVGPNPVGHSRAGKRGRIC